MMKIFLKESHYVNFLIIFAIYFRDEIRHFGVPEPEFLIEELRNDLEKTEEVWLLFDKFHAELQEFAKEEWIVFRYVLYGDVISYLFIFRIFWESLSSLISLLILMWKA